MGRQGVFHFQKFSIQHCADVFKVGTDGVLLGSWAQANGSRQVLDIGTGTGLIPLMLAQRYSEIEITGVDNLGEAVKCATHNVVNAGLEHRINIVKCDVANIKMLGRHFDYITSNPPFYSQNLASATQRNKQAKHLRSLTLLDWLKHASSVLTESGSIAIVLPVLEWKEIEGKLHIIELYLRRVCEVYPHADKQANRVLLQLGRSKTEVVRTDLVLYRDKAQTRTDAYEALVADFYLQK